jgi:hypothetical protein
MSQRSLISFQERPVSSTVPPFSASSNCHITYVGCPIEIWQEGPGAHGGPTSLTIGTYEPIDLPAIEEVDAQRAIAVLEAESAAAGGVAPWGAPIDEFDSQGGISRPATVSAVAVLLAVLAVVHALGALGSLTSGLAGSGIGQALTAGALALIVGIGEVICAVQVSRGRSWARIAAIALGLLVLVWLTMAPWSPGTLTVLVFGAWLAIGALLAHPLSNRFFAALDPSLRTA